MASVKAYYINLDSRPDRRAFMEKQMAALQLSATRIPAIDVTQALEMATPAARSALGKHTISPGELACNASHMAAWQEAFKDGAGAAFILEDDAALGPDLATALDSVEPYLANCHIIRLETRLRTSELSLKPRYQSGPYALHRFHSFEWGSAGYLITRSAAQRVMDSGGGDWLIFDRLLYDPARRHWHGLEIVQTVPAPVYHPGVDGLDGLQHSDLAKGRKDRKSALRTTLTGDIVYNAERIISSWRKQGARAFRRWRGNTTTQIIPFTGNAPDVDP